MKLLFVFQFVFLALFSYSQNPYADSLVSQRKEKESELLDPKKGVLTNEDLTHFDALNYFPIDTTYIVHAHFKKSIGKKFKMPTSTERTPIYRRYGYVNFVLHGKPEKLTVYQNMELKGIQKYDNYFFVPFRDKSSSLMTYGGGRYLDLTLLKKQATVKIDFNAAYNPYCAYSHRYSCPLPPEENTLTVFIYAGEKTPIYKTDK